ncbi:MAG: GNAT family N-acetyltransferase [Pseudomonadaceae bacterium]|nr:GNAT family N-acetyltransferase [Pseudomonadaceae bacterium]
MLTIPQCHAGALELVPLTQAHSAGMFALWSDSRVTRYSGPVNDYDGNAIAMPAATTQDSDLIIDFWLRAAEDGWGFRWAIMHRSDTGANRFAGTVGFNALAQRAEIAWHLLPEFWGRGIMSAACGLAIEWLAETNATEVEAFIEAANTKSIALATRLGMNAAGYSNDGADQYLMPVTR